MKMPPRPTMATGPKTGSRTMPSAISTAPLICFATSTPSIRAALAILGSAAIEGPVISWVADHRKHHAFSDRDGDPHSPHVDHGHGWRGALRGLLHAHVGWLFIHTHRARRTRYAPDLLADPVVSWVDRTFPVWAFGGLLAASMPMVGAS